jgi:YihY family inner membrane protein
VSSIERRVRRFDAFQQRHPLVGFPYAVVKKFGDDQGGSLASLVAYYGFFSLFPLLLVLVTVLGFVLKGNEKLQESILNSALANFPIIGDQLRDDIHALSGDGLTLVLAVLLTLWGGLGVVNALQLAMNRVWDVPYRDRPNFWKRNVRAVLMVMLLGAASVGAAVVAGIVAAGGSSGWVAVGGYVLSFVLNLGVFLLAFRILTARKLTWGDVLPGAVVAAVAWVLLQALGGIIVAHQLQSASQVYGLFGMVIGLLAWMSLGATVTIYSAEINVVRKERLWPRTLTQPPLSAADRRAYRRKAIAQERRPEVSVEVRFTEESKPAAEEADRAERERIRDVHEPDAATAGETPAPEAEPGPESRAEAPAGRGAGAETDA